MTELEAMREEIKALRDEVARLRGEHAIRQAPIVIDRPYPMPITLPAVPWYGPMYVTCGSGNESSAASGVTLSAGSGV